MNEESRGNCGQGCIGYAHTRSVAIAGGGSYSVLWKNPGVECAPVYFVRAEDGMGTIQEKTVDVNLVDPFAASFLDMLAYTANCDEMGVTRDAFGDLTLAAMRYDDARHYSAIEMNEEKNYISILVSAQKEQNSVQNVEAYLSYKELLDYMKRSRDASMEVQS